MSATPLLPPAFALPQSPVVAVALILAILFVTYLVLNVVAPVKATFSDDAADDADSTEEPEATDEVAETAPAEGEPEASAVPASDPPGPQVRVEAIRIREVPLALGDTASQVMRALRPEEGERMPLIERRDDGAAARVIRAYRVGGRLVTLVLERTNADEPLRLTALDIEEN